jgi:hypothetical protein
MFAEGNGSPEKIGRETLVTPFCGLPIQIARVTLAGTSETRRANQPHSYSSFCACLGAVPHWDFATILRGGTPRVGDQAISSQYYQHDPSHGLLTAHCNSRQGSLTGKEQFVNCFKHSGNYTYHLQFQLTVQVTTECTCVFATILRINNYHLPEQH